MSIVIIGGNECMAGRYAQLCKQHNCKAKVFCKPKGIKNQMGNPDLVVFFTNTVSHGMVNTATAALSGDSSQIVHCHSSSMSALKKILEEYAV